MPIKQTILVVEDERTIRDLLANALKTLYEVLVATDGLDAVLIYDRHVEQIAAIVTDLDMPRLGGQSLTEWVHHIRPQLPVVIMSGNQHNGQLEELLRQSTISFLPKPFDLDQLESILHRILGRHRGKLGGKNEAVALGVGCK
jgi:two-component system cell cycle sensor histidine kinase/response regulator CckA